MASKRKRKAQQKPVRRKVAPPQRKPAPSRPSKPVRPPKVTKRGKGGSKVRKVSQAQAREDLRRKRISLALKRFHAKRKTLKTFLEGDTKADKAWGKKLYEEAKRAQKQAKRKPPKIRKRDAPPVSMPPGYENIGGDKIGKVGAMLERTLLALNTPETMEALGIKVPLTVDLKRHVNSDESFDAELRVREIPRGLTIHKLAIYIEGLIDPIPSTFMSTGIRTEQTEELKGKKYERHAGKVQIGTNYFKARKKAIAFATGRMIQGRFIDKRYHKPSEFYVRIHWSPDGSRPIRKAKPVK